MKNFLKDLWHRVANGLSALNGIGVATQSANC